MQEVAKEIEMELETVCVVLGMQLKDAVCLHPFEPRDSPVVFGFHVTTESGTGLVHTAPGTFSSLIIPLVPSSSLCIYPDVVRITTRSNQRVVLGFHVLLLGRILAHFTSDLSHLIPLFPSPPSIFCIVPCEHLEPTGTSHLVYWISRDN